MCYVGPIWKLGMAVSLKYSSYLELYPGRQHALGSLTPCSYKDQLFRCFASLPAQSAPHGRGSARSVALELKFFGGTNFGGPTLGM